jgi:hypothetical protein
MSHSSSEWTHSKRFHASNLAHVLTLYLVGVRIETVLGYRLSWLRFVVFFLIPSIRILPSAFLWNFVSELYGERNPNSTFLQYPPIMTENGTHYLPNAKQEYIHPALTPVNSEWNIIL